MRLIDADELLKGKEDHQMISTHLIWNAPTVDAVRVVRCKDCKHRPERCEESDEYDMDSDLEFPDEVCPCQCYDYYYSWMPKDNWFCANGERKEE